MKRQYCFLAFCLAIALMQGCAPTSSSSGIERVNQGISATLASRFHVDTKPVGMRFGNGGSKDEEHVVVSEEYANTLSEYEANDRRNRPAVCQFGSLYVQRGLTTDSSGTLYAVGNEPHFSGVVSFRPKCGKQMKQFYAKQDFAEDPVVDGDILYLTDLGGDIGKNVRIYVFDIHGNGQPVRSLNDPPDVSGGLGVAADSSHNLFWSTANHSGGGQVIEFVHGRNPPQELPALTLGSDWPGGIFFDDKGNLLWIDQTARTINRYAPPFTSPPTSKISLLGTAVYCAFGKAQARIYCLDYEYGSVDIYSYPHGDYQYSYTNGIEEGANPIGIAIVP